MLETEINHIHCIHNNHKNENSHHQLEQRRQFSSGGSFRPHFIIAGFLNI